METRCEPRFPVKTTAVLRVLSDSDAGVPHVVMVDISKSGMRVECAHFLRHGSQVSIETKELTIVGTVQNCTEIRTGLFGFGIKIRDAA
jgi:hypothetical protein